MRQLNKFMKSSYLNKIGFILLHIFLIQFFGLKANAQNNPNELLAKSGNNYFIENKGQWDSDVLYLTRMGGLDAWITKKGVLYTFFETEVAKQSPTDLQIDNLKDIHTTNEVNIIGHRVWAKLQLANPYSTSFGKEKQAGYYNFLLGNDPSKHASNVGLYKEAVVQNVYTGIDARYYFDNGNLRYDYIVHPGADYRQIQMLIEGAFNTQIKNNNLSFTTRFGEVKQAELYVYQTVNGKQASVKSAWQQEGDAFSFALGDYDHNQTLVIDPLIYSTYIGGNAIDHGLGITTDASGYAYVTGRTTSTDYSTTSGVFQTTNGGSYDAFVSKLNTNGSALVYSTYIGGTGADFGFAIAVDASGNAFITGNTPSTNFPTTVGAFQTTKAAAGDVFVTKLNPTGTALVYSTFIGGSGNDQGFAIALDNSGNAFITGVTANVSYPKTVGAFQTTIGGTSEVFVTKLNSTGTALAYSTFIGGSSTEQGNGIAVDNSGNAYITGQTNSSNYDITSGAYQTTRSGTEAFVTKLNPTGTALIYSTFIGGTASDFGNAIAIDASGNAYITGYTASDDFDTTAGAIPTDLSIAGGGQTFATVSKLNSTGTALIYSTYLGGGSYNEYGKGIAVDGSGNAYVAGETQSTALPATCFAIQSNLANAGSGTSDLYVMKLDVNGALRYCSYLGSNGYDIDGRLAIDATSNVYLIGSVSSGWPTTSGAYDVSFNGGTHDVSVSKIHLDETCNHTWTGATSTAWGTATNWIPNIVPTGVYDVFIPDVTNDPIISAAVNVTNITLDAGATLTVSTGGSLTLNGTFANSGAVAILDGANFLQGGGSSYTGSGTFTVEKTVTNTADGYRDVCAPVATTVADLADDFPITGQNGVQCWYSYSPYPNVQTYDEALSIVNGNYYEGWLSKTGLSNAMNPMQGFAIRTYQGAPFTIDFTGAPNNGPKSIAITKTTSATTSQDGWNFVGNPYPSNIDWVSLAAMNPDITGSYYVFGTTGEYTGAWGTCNASGACTGTGALSGISRYISAGQGFFVKSTVANGSFVTNNTVRTTNASNFYKTDGLNNEIRLTLSNGINSDEILAYTDANATNGNDLGLDAEKIAAGSTVYMSYAMPNAEYAINVMNTFTAQTELPLTVWVKDNGSYTFTATSLNTPGLTAYLKDASTGSLYDLSVTAPMLSLKGNEAYNGRFSILFFESATTAVIETKETGIAVYSKESNVIIERSSSSQASITVSNMLGQPIAKLTTSESKIVLPLQNEPMGFVFVSVKEGQLQSVRKLLINNK